MFVNIISGLSIVNDIYLNVYFINVRNVSTIRLYYNL